MGSLGYSGDEWKSHRNKLGEGCCVLFFFSSCRRFTGRIFKKCTVLYFMQPTIILNLSNSSKMETAEGPLIFSYSNYSGNCYQIDSWIDLNKIILLSNFTYLQWILPPSSLKLQNELDLGWFICSTECISILSQLLAGTIMLNLRTLSFCLGAVQNTETDPLQSGGIAS